MARSRIIVAREASECGMSALQRTEQPNRKAEEQETMSRRKYMWDDAGVRHSAFLPVIKDLYLRSARARESLLRIQESKEKERESTIGDREVDVLPCSVRVTFPDRRYRDGRPRYTRRCEQSEQQDELMRRGSNRARYAAFMLISASASAYPRIKLMDVRGYSRDKSRTRIVDFGVTTRSVPFASTSCECCTRIDGNVADCFCKVRSSDQEVPGDC